MNNTLLQYKVKQRLNKLDSKDYQNLSCFAITEAVNKYQIEWSREKVKQGEVSKQVIEDIQPLLKDRTLRGTSYLRYFESEVLPKDFMSMSALQIKGKRDNCASDYIKSTLIESGNAEDYLGEYVLSPSFDWRETFHTVQGNRLRIYTNDDFKIIELKASYYRFPVRIAIEGCEDEFGKGVLDVECEFKDDVVEQLIKGACSIIAGDIEDFNQVQRNLTQ